MSARNNARAAQGHYRNSSTDIVLFAVIIAVLYLSLGITP